MTKTSWWKPIGLLFFFAGFAAEAVEVSGQAGVETRLFPHAPVDSRQHRQSVSVFARPEFYVSWDEGDQSVLLIPFARWDSADPRRTHWDLREFLWQTVSDRWETRVGVGHVFWGVTESRHLVDIVNQTDAVENIDGEDKLGQPMVNLRAFSRWGTLNLYVLPGFRPRTFPGTRGRLRTIPEVAGFETYESSSQDRHVDLAARWAWVSGDWDVGLSHFYGTSREPTLRAGLSPSGNPILIPHYEIIHQSGLDVQATLGAWLWKLEAIYRSGQGDDFVAASGGFEYTLSGFAGTRSDLGLLLEYHFDSRGDNATGFEDDLFAGVRLAFNDVQSTELLAGVVVDRESGANTVNVEGSRRLGDDWTLELEARAFNEVAAADPMFSVRRDDHVQLSLIRHF